MRLGLDIGTNSIGWWLYETNSNTTSGNIVGIIDGGVRIFSDGRDPKSKASLAVARREARAMRRRRDRYLKRRASLMKVLAASGLMPSDPEQAKALEVLDPYQLRAEGLDQKLPITHLGRALFHLNQRRGFKSNRKTDRGDNEGGKIKDATRRLDIEMAAQNCRTYGEFLHKRRQKAVDPREVPSVRTRLSIAARGGPDSKEESGYDFYPDRRHLEDEFIALWEAQKEYHPDLTAELRDLVFEKIFYQRPLKQPKVGLCLFTAEERLPKAHPLFQRRVLYETVNQLRVTEDGNRSRPLTLDERDAVIQALDSKKPAKSLASMNLKFTALGKVLKLQASERFTLEAGARDAIACDAVRAIMLRPDAFGEKWSDLDWEQQWQVISSVRDVQTEDEFGELVAWLIQEYKLDRENAHNVANAHLPDGHGRLGLTATRAILEKLEADVCTYSTAVELCGWHHSDSRTGECLDQLPYYGEVLDRHVIPGTYDENDDEVTRYGRITNPTVHIGLNQLRRLVNKIIEVYGKPSQIVVELARELTQSDAQKQDTIKGIRKATDEAIRRGQQLEELRQPNTGSNRMLLRLWEDLGPSADARCCPYTGKPISVAMLFDGSCDVDHILPYSRTLDDSFANRTVCLKEANRQKGNKTPWEVWGGTAQWETIEANLKNLPENKRKRFAKDAMERFEEDSDFLDRALVDTQYLSRISRTYLDTLYTEGGHVWAVNGRMTEMLRRHWGLNGLLSDKDRDAAKTKNRTDHRHHAIDAAVIAATDRSLIKKISDAARRGADAGQSAELITKKTPPPWETFRSDIATKLNNMIVSHRLDHGRIDPEARKIGKDTTAGQLHNDTAYGVIDDSTVASRTPLMSLKPSDIEISSTGKNIRDPNLQHALQMATDGKEGKDFENALADFASKDGPYKGIRRVRLVETLQKSARVEVGKTKGGQPLKAYKADSNHCYELWKLPDGKIVPQVVTTYEAHAAAAPRPHPAAKRVLRVFKKDTVALDRNGETFIGYVQSMHIKNGLCVAPHNEANADARNRDKMDPFKFLQMGASTLVKLRIRRVTVNEIGCIRDPGPPKL